jgi:hypothetical protein
MSLTNEPGFWGAKIEAGKNFKCAPSSGLALRVSTAALGPGFAAGSAAALIAVDAKNTEIVLCHLNAAHPSANIDCFFLSEAHFKVLGNTSVHIAGYLTLTEFDISDDEGGGFGSEEEDADDEEEAEALAAFGKPAAAGKPIQPAAVAKPGAPKTPQPAAAAKPAPKPTPVTAAAGKPATPVSKPPQGKPAVKPAFADLDADDDDGDLEEDEGDSELGGFGMDDDDSEDDAAAALGIAFGGKRKAEGAQPNVNSAKKTKTDGAAQQPNKPAGQQTPAKGGPGKQPQPQTPGKPNQLQNKQPQTPGNKPNGQKPNSPQQPKTPQQQGGKPNPNQNQQQGGGKKKNKNKGNKQPAATP